MEMRPQIKLVLKQKATIMQPSITTELALNNVNTNFLSLSTLSYAPMLAEDILVLKDEEHPTWQWSAGISEVDGRYLEISVIRDTSRAS